MFFCEKNACMILRTTVKIFSAVTKNRCHLHQHIFQKSQKYLYTGKNIKKNFLQLRFSNVLLHLKYKVLLCDPNIVFNNLAGRKALATNHSVQKANFENAHSKILHNKWQEFMNTLSLWISKPVQFMKAKVFELQEKPEIFKIWLHLHIKCL